MSKMKPVTITFLCLLALAQAFSATGNATSVRDSLMRELHSTIEQRDVYVQRKEDRLTDLRRMLGDARGDEARFLALGALLDEFRPYNTDSALAYCRMREELAVRTGRRDQAINAALNTANVLGSMGLYKEALEITDTIPPEGVPEWLRPYYHYISHTVYSSLADYSLRPEDRKRYLSLSAAYQDSIIAHSEPGTLSYVVNVADRHNSRGEYGQAIEILEKYLSTSEYTTHDRAICSFTLAYAYRHTGNDEKAEENMIIASIADLQAAVREYVSLRQLGVHLYKKGDVADAYEFLRISMDDAIKCNARLRILEINDIFPIVNESYVKAIHKEKDRQRTLTWVISLLSLFLMLAVWRVWLQMKKTAEANKEARQTNEKLKALNNELTDFNTRLTEANREIAENSHIKEEYIAQYMDQCSVYIEKLDAYRRSLNKLLSGGKSEELKKALKSTDLMDEELKAFYKNFDATFLKLFPDFVEHFNELLVPEERVTLKKEGQLNTQLRIFALIRLGITDSVKIAQFLRYSVTTIYNYRTQTRNKAAGPRNEFEGKVMKIS